MSFLLLLLLALVVILFRRAWKVLMFLTWRPYKITNDFRRQGLKGPEYKFWSGSIQEIRRMRAAAKELVLDTNSHNIAPKVLPHYNKWQSQYGRTFLYWFGPQLRICVSDPELVKQILSNKFGFYTKSRVNPNILALLGKGLVLTEGSDWARHRRVVSPAFTMDKLKISMKKMVDCSLAMIEGWQNEAVQATDGKKVIEVNRQFQELTADVISHAAFGSSYAEGKEVFFAQKELQVLAVASALDIDIAGFQYLPTGNNLKKWKLERKVKGSLERIIRGRLNSKDENYGSDLLGLMLEACHQQNEDRQVLSMDEIIDECKTFFFAGHETTSHLLTWTMFLLSVYPEWQERLRNEVIRECGKGVPDVDTLSKLKLVTIVLLEALRLYCPVVMMLRKADKDMTLGSLKIPKGTVLTIPVVTIHRDKEVWGPDANEFNPQRFENGISKAAKHPNAFLSFSIGPRACVGQNFAMLEAKIVLSMILQTFTFRLSSDYKHAPADLLTLQPQYGVPVVLTLLRE